MGPEMYYSVLGIPGTLELIAAADCVRRHLEYDQLPELHLCIIAQKRVADGDEVTDVDVRATRVDPTHRDAALHHQVSNTAPIAISANHGSSAESRIR